MRLLVRLGLAACAVVFLLICLALSRFSKIHADEENNETVSDEAVKILLLSDAGNGAADGAQNAPPKITFNVAVVLVVSLLSVVLLITGIIVLAVTLDPNSRSDDDEDFEEYDYRESGFRPNWFEEYIDNVSDNECNMDSKVPLDEL